VIRLAATGTLLLAVLAACASAAPERETAPQRASLHIRTFASGLDSPTYLTSAPGEPGNLYVVEQPGRILVLAGGKRRVFLDIRDRVKAGGEQGLLSVAFPPDYAKSRRFYVDYTDVNGNTRVVELRARGGRADPAGARQLLFVEQPYSNHNGGQLQFGPDGLLYVGMGDGGSGGDPGNRAQNLAVPLGKLLRIDPTRPGARWFTAGYGLRNPWRFSFDRATGDLWIADVGQNEWEEIDRRTRAQLPRRWNYGWSVLEGRHRFKDAPLNRSAPLVAPTVEYSHSATGGCSVTGGYVYRGSAVPAAKGRYFYGDYCNGAVWSLRGKQVRREPFKVPELASFGEDAAGELYLVSLGGTIYKLSR
jgi:glucose/arabinose dehydrogenase